MQLGGEVGTVRPPRADFWGVSQRMISNWSNLLARRDLLRELTVSELRARSQETSFGWVWWLVDPLIMMLIYWAVVVGIFGRGANYTPYPVFILCALLPWKHFTGGLGSCSRILRNRDTLIKSIAFPTMVLPLTVVAAGFSNFLFGLVVLVGTAFAFGLPLGLPLIQIPLLMGLQLCLVTGLCLAASCAGALVRDLSGFLGHLTRIGFYVAPSLYGIDMVEKRFLKGALGDLPGAEHALTIYLLNPFATLITGYREAIFYDRFMQAEYWALLTVESLVLLIVGYRVYQYFDRRVIKFL